MKTTGKRISTRSALLAFTAMATGLLMSSPGLAQTAPTTGDQSTQVGDIIVTAQRRSENLQDVPIAITAITSETLEANRVTNVSDLNGLAPGVTVRPAAGASGIPAFSIRGLTSYGVVPGSDKQVSVYLDGVYISSSRGSLFELPDIQRIEVLRGPQGTLFGRNATAGAISIVTRDPYGEFGIKQDLTAGNFEAFRSRTTIDTPTWNGFSGYLTYVHDERNGDIRNRGAGTSWDRTGPSTRVGVQTSPEYLGSKDADTIFAAIQYHPNDAFKMTYKFDHAANDFTSEGYAPITYNRAAPLVGSLVTALVTSQATPVVFATSGDRPDAVNNAFAVGGRQRNSGHSLTTEYQINEHFSVKNVAAYRDVFITSATQLDGLGGLVFTQQALVPYATFAAFSQNPSLALASPAVQGATIGAFAAGLAPAVGSRFCFVCNNSQSTGRQWSDELTLNYTSDRLDLTTGFLYFFQKDRAGGPIGIGNNIAFTTLPNSGRIPLGNESSTYSKGESIAAYLQGQIHITSQLDLVAGARITQDTKSGAFINRGTYVAGPGGFTDGTFVNRVSSPFTYDDTQPTYSLGVNYSPSEAVLLFAKYSTAFVSGGSVGSLPFAPETVASTEIGMKGDFLDRRLRANLSIFNAEYEHLQSAQSGSNVGQPQLGTVIIDQGDQTARGFELEVTARPTSSITLTGSTGYTDIKFGSISPVLITSAGLTAATAGDYQPAGIPAWTATLSAQYDSQPLFGDTTLTLRTDATWHSDRRNNNNPNQANLYPGYDVFDTTPASWIVNGRAALHDVGPGNLEIAFWGRNIFDNKEMQFPLNLNGIIASSFVAARTFGVDISASF